MSLTKFIDTPKTSLQFSVIIASDTIEGLDEHLAAYRKVLDAMAMPYECICVVDGRRYKQFKELADLEQAWPELDVIGLRPWGGEDAAISQALRRSKSNLVLLLPGWQQTDAEDLPRLFDALETDDMVTATRANLPQKGWLGFRHRVFEKVLKLFFGQAPADPFCRVRLVRKDVLEDVCSFGVRQHFIPVIAGYRGYSVKSVEMRPAPEEESSKSKYVFNPLGHFRAFFDAVTLYVVVTFLRRPLRFFGAIGLPLFVVGALTTAFLLAGRVFGQMALADRPALIFAVLMLILGVQIIAIGLVGEIIIFAGSRRLKQYEVSSIIHNGDDADFDAAPIAGANAEVSAGVKDEVI